MKIKRLLIVSLLLNLVFCILGGAVLYRRGGVSYIKAQVKASRQPPPPPFKTINTPWYQDRKNFFALLPQTEAPIIFAGDSITDFGPWTELLGRPVMNRGIAGDLIEGLRGRIDEVLRHHPRQLFLMIGINDLTTGKSGDAVFADYSSLVKYIQSTSPRTQIFLQSTLPVNIAIRSTTRAPKFPPRMVESIMRLNQRLAQTADGKKIVYLDVYSKLANGENQLDPRFTQDGLHLKAEGYWEWRKVLLPHLLSVS